MTLNHLIVIYFLTIGSVISSDDSDADDSVPRYSIFDKDVITSAFKGAEPAVLQYFKDENLTLSTFQCLIQPESPLIRKDLKQRFLRLDTDHNKVFDSRDFSPLKRFVFYLDFVILGAFRGNDFSLSKREFSAFLEDAPFHPNKKYIRALRKVFDIVDFDHNGIWDPSDFLVCHE
ncbi:hypothetical protein BgiMline_031801 [Biomphalaria glabrata]|uniref:Uncharacterized protein LOC106071432 n=1 Tax=Biomphalaria glabrata TaxID=6526 RepID=A0A2C9LTR4_BIOGL|nr:uncharacterized protein LOC106071432 [Biomphalaria glabrata]KAI8746281.1 hypothetical protein BgiMline_019997 [Biomphalaria glabrata]KAI8780283.1 hypothetical protein BgiBS90_019477 [Biomphalaria glabrata]